jgi:hypothetical protein
MPSPSPGEIRPLVAVSIQFQQLHDEIPPDRFTLGGLMHKRKHQLTASRGTDLPLHSQAKLSAIARQLNERPRKTLLYQTPAEKFEECVAAIS